MKRRNFVASTLAATTMGGVGWGGLIPKRAKANIGIGNRVRERTRIRPNVIVIVVDDMRFDEYGLGGHPYLRTPHIDALGRSGVQFSSAYHTTPLCSPNRASILTGQYASRHGILDNTSRAHASHQLHTFAQELQRAGYETAHVGKWHMGNDPTPRPGYDEWISFEGQGRSIDPLLYEQGRIHQVNGYVTDIFSDRAIEFATRTRSKPFMLFVGHKAVHPDVQQRDDGSVDSKQGGRRFIPAPRHVGRYEGLAFPRRPNFGMSPELRRNSPTIAAALDLKTSPSMTRVFGKGDLDPVTSDETIQARSEMMLAVDESVGALVAALEEKSLRDNTMIMFMSDNGYFFGEHGLGVERRLPYEEAVRSPLLISHPGEIAGGRILNSFALSVDVAPTVVEVAGAEIPRRMQGESLVPLLYGPKNGGSAGYFNGHEIPWRDSFLVEYYGHDNPFPWIVNLDYRMIRMGRYKYIRWIRQDNAEELYDLVIDPFEEKNLAVVPSGTSTLRSGKVESVLLEARKKMSSFVLESMDLAHKNDS